MKACSWRRQAQEDADRAAAWYAEQGGLALELAFIDALESTVEMLAEHPGSGSTRHAGSCVESEADMRFFRIAKFEHYLIYYIAHPDCIDIIRIWNASRGLDALFEADK